MHALLLYIALDSCILWKKLQIVMGSEDQMDLLSRAWCNSAVQVLHPSTDDRSTTLGETHIVAFEKDTATAGALPLSLQKGGGSLKEDGGDFRSRSGLNFDDLKSWIWLQKAIHPELDYDLCMKKKWFSKNMVPWKGVSIKKWMKKMKQLRKEEERLQRAEVHAAVSVAGVAAALAAISAETAESNQHKSLRDTAIASAAALVAAQCAHVAEAVGAKREHISAAINEAAMITDAAAIFTLTAAAATSLRGAATLRGRRSQRDRAKGSPPRLGCGELGFDFGRCRASLAKGDEILVATEDGKRRIRSVSAILSRNGKVILRIKKIMNILMVFSTAQESVIYDLDAADPLEEPEKEADGSYCIGMQTSQGKIELKIYDYVQYKKWITTINHMLMLSSTFNNQSLRKC